MLNYYGRASLLWAIISATATSIPGSLIPRITGATNFVVDNTSHFLIFLVLANLVTRSFMTRNPPFSGSKSAIIASLLTISYGFALEIIQIAIPSRAFEWTDAISNGLGAVVGALIAVFWMSRADKK